MGGVHSKLQEQGFTFAKASVYKAGENESDPYMMQARGIYNLKLAVLRQRSPGILYRMIWISTGIGECIS